MEKFITIHDFYIKHNIPVGLRDCIASIANKAAVADLIPRRKFIIPRGHCRYEFCEKDLIRLVNYMESHPNTSLRIREIFPKNSPPPSPTPQPTSTTPTREYTPHLPVPQFCRPTPVFWSVCFLLLSWLVIIAATITITYYFTK